MKRWAVACVLVLVSVSLFAQAIDIGPPPGRLVDVGGRKLHLHCTGSGSPTVVLEAGASAFAIDWALVQPEIARTQRVCSYDRAGSGWSDPRKEVETPARIVADLHAALTAAMEQPPFVLVGASAGGLYVRLYQLDHRGDVAGLVLVDPSSEDRLFTVFQQKTVPIASLSAQQLLTTLPTTAFVAVPPRAPQTGTPFDRLPPDLYELRIKIDRRLIASVPANVRSDIVLESSEGQRSALARLLEARSRQDNPMRDVPVVVLTRGQDMTPRITDSHAGLARLSQNSRHSVVSGAGHEIHLFVPSAVVQAIQDVSASVRQKSLLPARP
ncbi:MAG TPA: alpha/beta hydrolase [Vicinamibacterales bacterium]|nr:alpha/beta hydrolase [Vicinamibacterales bacterium]